jgi:hypothetical protein
MPQAAWSTKRERQYEHIKDGLEERGRPEKQAKEIAARTVNKERARGGESAPTADRAAALALSSTRKPSGGTSRADPGCRKHSSSLPWAAADVRVASTAGFRSRPRDSPTAEACEEHRASPRRQPRRAGHHLRRPGRSGHHNRVVLLTPSG